MTQLNQNFVQSTSSLDRSLGEIFTRVCLALAAFLALASFAAS
jgi:hypothetical protein